MSMGAEHQSTVMPGCQNGCGYFTDERLRGIVADGVQEAFTRIGVEADDPLEMQRDFAHLRSWREATEEVQRKGLLTIVGLLVTGGFGALVLYFKGVFHVGT